MIKLILLLLLCNKSLRYQESSEDTIRHIIEAHPDEPNINNSEFIFKGGVANQPKPEKEKTGGEDALIFSKNFMAVADGVGGWANQGIDSSKYSIALIKNVKDLFYKNSEHYSNKPKDLLVDAAVKNTEIGTSTLIICTLWKNQLKVGFIGDSGYMIFKPQMRLIQRLNLNNIIYHTSVVSEEQEHAFNFPYQIGSGGNNPQTESLEFSHDVNIGDIVLVISDGVLDNLYPQEIEFHLNKYIQDNKIKFGFSFWDIILNFDGQAFADYLLEKTFERSLDKTFVSPFSSGALTAGMILQGGKSDDISIAVGMITFSEKKMKTIKKVDCI